MKKLLFIYDGLVVDTKKEGEAPQKVVYLTNEFSYPGFCVHQIYAKIRGYKSTDRRQVDRFLESDINEVEWGLIETCQDCNNAGFPCYNCKCYFMNGGIKYEHLQREPMGEKTISEILNVKTSGLDMTTRYDWNLIDNTILCGHNGAMCIAII